MTNQITIWFQTLKQGSDITIETSLYFKPSLIFAVIIPGINLSKEELLAIKNDPKTPIYDQVSG